MVEQKVYMVMLTVETIIDLTFPDISSTFTNFSPGLKWGAFLGKILKRKSDICTKGTFLHELYFVTRMRTMQKIHINKNYKLSPNNLARSKMTVLITFFAIF